MEIRGELQAINADRLILIAAEKNQILDIFYTPSRLPEIKILVPREKVIFDVILQTVEIKGEKLGKFWLNHILFPRPPLPPSRKKGDSDRNWAQNQVDRTKS
ncbi:hypothetical protein [Chryseobacterium proteolyticum]|uniref:hypothetical protein n=1 Tax=Chryseobacterium proteolyticum TaxID=118127 RepID=UPI003983D960